MSGLAMQGVTNRSHQTEQRIALTDSEQKYHLAIQLLPNIQVLISLKNLGNDQDLLVFIQTLISKQILSFIFLVLINTTLPLCLGYLSHQFVSLTFSFADCMTLRKLFCSPELFICEKRLDLPVCVRNVWAVIK